MKTFLQYITEESTQEPPVGHSVAWTKPDLDSEIEELHLAADVLKLDKSKLTDAFHAGVSTPLTHEVWSRLQNTDSNEKMSLNKIHDLVDTYKKDESQSRSLNKAFKSGASLPSPIVLRYKNKHYLVAGNTRLMIAKHHGVTPIVHMIDYHPIKGQK